MSDTPSAPQAEPGRTIVFLGALSAMAEATARLHAAEGDTLILAARHSERLETLKADLTLRGARDCVVEVMDLGDVNAIPAALARWRAVSGRIDRAYVFYGVLGDQARAETQMEHARQLLQVNFTSAAEWCLALANVFEDQQSGVLIAASSVAGDRGRQSNYVYGAAKAGLTTLVQGIDHRLAKTGGKALAVKLGFVTSPMTAGMGAGPLWTSAEDAAALIKKGADTRRGIIYAPWFWRWILAIIKSAPAPIFNKTKL